MLLDDIELVTNQPIISKCLVASSPENVRKCFLTFLGGIET